MILLDTHIWIWWSENSPRLSARDAALIAANLAGGIAVSVISCWETAKLVSLGRLVLSDPVGDWIDGTLARPGVGLIAMTPQIAVEACRLPAPFHKDPADEILVATARVLNIPILTADRRILAYPHVSCLS
jgi:PIN domain nuclease of toxin-antitoxin system